MSNKLIKKYLSYILKQYLKNTNLDQKFIKKIKNIIETLDNKNNNYNFNKKILNVVENNIIKSNFIEGKYLSFNDWNIKNRKNKIRNIFKNK